MTGALLMAGEFAKKARVSIPTLHHYDSMGLLTPTDRGESGYRYYSILQLSEVNLIRTLQDLGVPLQEIKALKVQRTPERTAALLRAQLPKIRAKINNWVDADKLIKMLLSAITSVEREDESAITIQFLSRRQIFLGEKNYYKKGENGYDALVRFYQETERRYPGVDINYPVWGRFSRESAEIKMQGGHIFPEQYYCYDPDGKDERPAGLYVIGYARGGYGANDVLYVRLKEYIDQSGFEVCGDAYEEYPLNELCVSDSDNYLMRVMIAVREKKKD